MDPQQTQNQVNFFLAFFLLRTCVSVHVSYTAGIHSTYSLYSYVLAVPVQKNWGSVWWYWYHHTDPALSGINEEIRKVI